MIEQGFSRGSCNVKTKEGDELPACRSTLQYTEETGYRRVITSLHLSRPEDYFSIYQSGCNHSCLKCHSSEFSKYVNGRWMSTDEIAEEAAKYRKQVTVMEPREAATSWHANRLCRHCGACFITGKQAAGCPGKLKREQIVLSPQGFGPARNIVAFTGGDILCRPEFYLEAAGKIKERAGDLWILLETNGYGLTPDNLKLYAQGGIDAFWLDIKAYSKEKYLKLCGTVNDHILKSVERIIDLGFSLEILTLYIPGMVETDEHERIAGLIAAVDPDIPTTLLAFFPCYKLSLSRAPAKEEMARSYLAMKEAGLQNIRLGNLGVFIKDKKDLAFLTDKLGDEAY
jgi:pyruvate formate lyase activating enzyme